jgi:4-coumarate--CoA ligase
MVIKSPYPLIDVPQVDIPTFLFETERPPHIKFPRNHKIFIDAKSGRGLSLGELHDQSRRFGQGLKEKWGWKKGDVLCIFSVNQVDTGVVIWGIHYALGVGIFLLGLNNVVSPANPAYTEEELLHQLQDSKAKAILTIAELLPIAIKAGHRANIPPERIILYKEAKDGHKVYTDLFSKNLAESTRGKLTTKDIAFLAYSSGTTGLAKGVMLTHGNITSNTLQGSAIEAKRMHWKEDRLVSFLPFYHI